MRLSLSANTESEFVAKILLLMLRIYPLIDYAFEATLEVL